jgi:hypothetical protein
MTDGSGTIAALVHFSTIVLRGTSLVRSLVWPAGNTDPVARASAARAGEASTGRVRRSMGRIASMGGFSGTSCLNKLVKYPSNQHEHRWPQRSIPEHLAQISLVLHVLMREPSNEQSQRYRLQDAEFVYIKERRRKPVP